MSQLGFTVMVKRVFGVGHGEEILAPTLGKRIQEVYLGDDALHFIFDNGRHVKIIDQGQCSCERRYMTTDDDLGYFIGSILLGIEVKNAPPLSDGYTEHEMQFLEVQTDKGVFTLCAHNEHNGYYSGFWICAEEVE